MPISPQPAQTQAGLVERHEQGIASSSQPQMTTGSG